MAMLSEPSTFLPEQEVEWKHRLGPCTTESRRGVVISHDFPALSDDQRTTLAGGDLTPVLDLFLKIHLVPTEALEIFGSKEAARHQRALDNALNLLATAQRALSEAHWAVQALPFADIDDSADSEVNLDVAAGYLRDVSRTLRLNGARS